MLNDPILFNNGAAYERYMGKWSRLAGEAFLDWLAPKPGLSWLDVGCGNGAFTEIVFEHYAPLLVHGIDPSAEQLAYACARPALQNAQLQQGDAMALPFPDNTFDVAVMPLVIFFVPDPAKGVSEMVRVVRPGGTVAAYAWDLSDGGFPYETLQVEMRKLGVDVPVPPSPAASRIDAMQNLWMASGLEDIETREISVQRTFLNFDDYWETILGGASVGPKLAKMASEDLELLKTQMRVCLATDPRASITYNARANAIKGRVRK